MTVSTHIQKINSYSGRELSDAEKYSAAALFTVALQARQGTYPHTKADQLVAEVQQDAEKAPAAVPGAKAHDIGNPLGWKIRPVTDNAVAVSTSELCCSVYKRLCIQSRAFEGLQQIPSIHSDATVRETLGVYLIPLAANHTGGRQTEGGGMQEIMAVVFRHLIDATFTWAPKRSSLEEASDEDSGWMPDGQKKSGADDLPTLPEVAAAPVIRWHDARAAQAVYDLASWLRAEGAPGPDTIQDWMCKAATASIIGHVQREAQAELQKSKWGVGRALAVGSSAVVGGTLLAVTGGLAAPAVLAGLSSVAGFVGGAGAVTAVSSVATTATVTTALGAAGAGAGGRAMAHRTDGIKQFAFLPSSQRFMPGVAHVAVELKISKARPDWPIEVHFHVRDPETESESVEQTRFSRGMRRVFRKSSTSKSTPSQMIEKAKKPWAVISHSKKEASKPTSSSASRDEVTEVTDNALQAANNGTVAEPSGLEDLETASVASTASETSSEAESSSSKGRSSKWKKWKAPEMKPFPLPTVGKGAVAPECTICISGWVKDSPAGFVQPFERVIRNSARPWGEPDVYCLVWESKELMALHQAIFSLVGSYAASQLSKWFFTTYATPAAGLISASAAVTTTAVLASMAAMAVPGTLLMATSMIDNSWSMVLDRADKGGIILAQRLMMAPMSRPVRLVGFSMGARLIFSCLLELARCGQLGVVSEVILLGAPVSITPAKWCAARSVVAGRFINGYCGNDWLLGIVFRTSRAYVQNAAGLQAVTSVCEEARVEDVDLLAEGLVTGHTDYASEMGRILAALGVVDEGYQTI